jgi:hypothetical protein
MKTSSELQAQSVRRKLAYFIGILVLFTLATFSGNIARALTGSTPSWTIAHLAQKLQLTETTQGHADVAGSTVRLALTGSRGFAVCFLWVSAQEMQKRHEWNRVEVLVQSITKLQPHFLTPWLFQSWNLSYNVSVESDRVRDKYFYISKGIQLLAEGERINRGIGSDELGDFETGNPDMRYWVGFYYMNKFGNSDESNTLRSLFQMSCINPSKRMRLKGTDGQIDMVRFREFVTENPMLVRRLRERLKCNTPDDFIEFVSKNEKIPTRYEESDTGWHLKRSTGDQFPVVPDSVWDPSKSGTSIDLGTLRSEYADNYDSFRAAHWWMCFAQDPLPPYEHGKPARATPPEKPLRHRVPRSPMLILFRQAPPRCLTYIAEFRNKEGWFDESGWIVDEDRGSTSWFRNSDGSPERLVIGADPRYAAREAWANAYEQWNRHGDEHGMKMDQAKIDRLENVAQEYRRKYNVESGSLGPELDRAQVDSEMWSSFDAHLQLTFLRQNLTATNYRHFLYQSQAESDPRIVAVRKLFFDANRQRLLGNPDLSMQRYETAFDRLRGDPATGQSSLLEEYPNFRNDTPAQEELIEHSIEYVRLMNEHRGGTVRTCISAIELLRQAGLQTASPFNPAGIVAASLMQHSPSVRSVPLFSGPLDGVDSKGTPWLQEKNILTVKQRLGIIRAPNTPPATTSAPPPQ